MKNSNWTDQLSQQMEHHEVEAPAGLWEGIEQGLAARKSTRRAKLVTPWRAVAAAAVVTGVVVGVQLWRNVPGDNIAQTERPHGEAASQKQTPDMRVKASAALPDEPLQCAAMVRTWFNEVVETKADTTVLLADVPSDEPQETPLVEDVHTDQDKASGHNDKSSDLYDKDADRYTVPGEPREKSRVAFPKKRRTASPVSFQLMAMAGGTPTQQSYDMSIPVFGEFYWEGNDTVALQSQRRERVAMPSRAQHMVQSSPTYTDHDFPVKFGAMVRVPLNRRFAFDVGLSYACLRSDLNFTTQSGERKVGGTQRVNYLGVPVALTGDLWTNNRWLLYASAGGEVAKSVKTSWRDREGREYRGSARPWQCSVSAAVGLQLNLSRHVGLYVQPSLDYYFDNHSSVQTYYNEHPFTPALRMGVRVKL